MLQNILIDLGTVTDSNEENLATESYVDNSLSDYATKSELPSGYFTDVDYTSIRPDTLIKCLILARGKVPWISRVF